MINIEVTGLREAEKKLAKLGTKIAKDIVRKATREAAKPTLAAIKRNISSLGSGKKGLKTTPSIRPQMLKALKLAVKKKPLPGSYVMQIRFLSESEDFKKKNKVGVSNFIGYTKGSKSFIKSRKTTGYRYFIPFAIEYGHAFPGRGGGKGAPKDVAAKPYIRPAHDANKHNAIRIMRNMVLQGIERYGG